MNPAFLDDMSWEMAEVYGAVTDQILINLARYFPYYESGDDIPKSAFTYQAQMLAQMGQVNRETVRIIRNGLADADGALKGVLEAAIVDSVRQTEPELYEAVKKGVFALPTTPVLAPNQMRAYKLYYEQAATKLNLVNTVMLESTQSAYQQAVSGIVSEMDIVERIGRTQTAMDAATGETITGVSAWNQAVKHATDRMKESGITGFIDHGGHHWSAESYVAMDVRTTTFNTARAAVWETNESFGNDLYLVSSHSGARPLCYPWQNKVISSMNASREVPDLDGNPVHVYAQDETSYGQPAGLFGINCGHYPTPFIPGISTADNPVQDKEANDKAYAESQEQRRLERKLREEKRDLAMAKAQGASDEEIKKLREKCRNTSQDIDDFCEQTGRARHRDREAVYTKREFPDQKKYDVSKFETEQKERLEEYWKTGGTQQGRKFQQMTPLIPINPAPTPAPAPIPQTMPTEQATVPVQTVVPAQPETPPVEKSELEQRLDIRKIERVKVEKYTTMPTETEIIDKISGADRTKGSCASLSVAYAGNKCGYNVRDFRGGNSQFAFSQFNNIRDIGKLDGVVSYNGRHYNDFTNIHNLLKNVQPGKEYILTAGKHAAVVRQTETGIEYLELQSGFRKNTWYPLNDGELKRRFGCQKSHTMFGMKYENPEVLIEIDSLNGNKQFEGVLEFINTEAGKEMKGIGGGEK